MRLLPAIAGAALVLAGLPALAADAPAPLPASFSLSCRLNGTSTANAYGDIRGDGVITHPERVTFYDETAEYRVTTEPKTVVQQSRNGTSRNEDGVSELEPAGAAYFDDVRVLTPEMLVFCTDAVNRCRPHEKSTDSGGKVGTSTGPMIVNLIDGKLTYFYGMTVTGANGSMFTSRTDFTGTCTKGN